MRRDRTASCLKSLALAAAVLLLIAVGEMVSTVWWPVVRELAGR